jgi:hypothetical protein
MSGAAVAARGATETAQAATRAERSSWLASLKDESLSFFKGDNNAPWAILAETVIGCIPIVGQLVDARDIIKGLVEVSGAPASPLAWFNLITALVGLVPGGGDAAKRSLRAVKSGAVQVDDLLDMIRRIYKGDPEKLLKDVLDVSKLRKYLNDILDNPSLTSRLSPEVRRTVDDIQANLNKQFDAFKKEIDGWLAKGRKTSADGLPHSRSAPNTPPAKPQTQAKAGTQSKAPHGDSANPHTGNPAKQRNTRFRQLSQKVLGVLGEHMADYHCQDVKGWGSKVVHDSGQVNNAKLNDHGQLVQLWPTIPRGRGIDAVWKSNGPKPYAIIEAKASFDPTKSLRALLGEAGDKTGKDGVQAGTTKKKGRNAKSATAPKEDPTDIRQTNGKVTQMGKGWINYRMESAVKKKELAETIIAAGYSRHVLFFSIPQAVAHAEALIMHLAQQPVDPAMHGAHQVTREWGDRDIDKVVDNRAGYTGAGRDKRTR